MAMAVRDVWNWNLDDEFRLVEKLLPHCPYGAMDTEFPGTVIRPQVPKQSISRLPPPVNYAVMKANVDALNLIQVGLTLSDAAGNSFVWQFNIKDFDADSDLQNSDSIALLKEQGIDFARNRAEGIESARLARRLLRSRLVFHTPHRTWVTFHGGYDFGFLVKILTRKPLPSDQTMFLNLVKVFFGRAVFDMKHMMRFCDGLFGGLDRVAKALDVLRVAGKSHQAGSDSLLTMQAFFKLRAVFFNGLSDDQLHGFKNILYGLEVQQTQSPPQPILMPISPQVCNHGFYTAIYV